MANRNGEEQIRRFGVCPMDLNIEEERRKFSSSSVSALGRGADLANFSSVYLSDNYTVLLFVHSHSKLSNSVCSGTKLHLI